VARVIDVVGVPAAGLESLDEPTRALVRQAPVVVGSPRLLALLPPHEPQHDEQRRLAWPSPLRAGLPALFREVGTDQVVVLATGDPLLSGVGATLVEVLGAEVVRIHPAVSSVALARARMRWSAEQSTVVSLVSTPASAVRRHLAPAARLVILSAGAKTPGEVAAELVDAGWPQAEVTVLGALGSSTESTHGGSAAEWLDSGAPAGAPQPSAVPPLNIVAVRLPEEHAAYGTTPGLPTSAFDHDGQVTKSEVRAAALAALRPMPGQLLWDLGAGAGSVGIEWARAAHRARTIAVERNPERAERIRRNAAALGVPQLEVVQAGTDLVTTPGHGLPRPDAVFVGGGASEPVIAAAWEALRPYGRMVVHAVTLETEALAVAAFREHGGELRRLTVERAEPLGAHLSWTPARPVVQWSCTKQGPTVNEGPL
jgi:precorrin-6Y C5,15-methyltransferase (decarboxylating)